MSIASNSLVIAVIVLIIAAIAVIGGVVELLKQRVIVDPISGQVIEIEIPGFGKVKTNYPSVAAIFLGLAMAAGVLQWLAVEIEQMPFTATVTVRNPDSTERKTADVFLSVIPQRYKRSQSGVSTNKPVDIKLNVDKGEQYDVIVYSPIYMRSDGTVQRTLQFGPMKTEYANGQEIGTFKAELIVEWEE